MGVRFLVCIIDVYSKYTWGVSLKGITITSAFQKVLNGSGRKSVDQGRSG